MTELETPPSPPTRFGVWGLGFRVQGSGFRVTSLSKLDRATRNIWNLYVFGVVYYDPPFGALGD